MSEGEARPLYAHQLGSSIHVFLPDEYNSADPQKWLGVVAGYLADRGYEVVHHQVWARSRISAEPCAVLHVHFAPKKGELRHRNHNVEQLHELLGTKYTAAVYTRFERGYAFDQVVGSQVRLAGAPGTPHNVDPTKHLDWLRERRIEYHVTSGSVSCFTLPASCDPEAWQHTLANSFGAFVLREDTNWG